MATVSEKCNGTYGSHYTLYLEYSLNSQDYKNNCSNITVSMYGKSDSTSYKAYNTSAVNPVSLSVEGSTKVSKNISMDFRNKKTVSMASWTGNVYHNSRGELSVDLAGSFSIKGVSSLRGGSISRSWTLPTIPRESSVTCTDGNIESSVTVNINRASSSFSHTITYNFQGLTGTIATKTGNTSIGWTLPTSFFAKIPNSKSASGTIKCETYDGSTYIGSSTCRFNAFVSNSEPTISATVEDVNATTIALTGNKNKLIKYKSTAKVVINATAKNSSSISSYKTVCAGKSASTATSNITEIESGNFDVSCTDSRGFTSSTTVKKEIVDYIKLAITSLELSRPNTTSNTVNISLKGNYFNASFGSVSNTLALKFRSRISGGTWGSYINLNPTKSGNTFLISGNLGSTYNFNNEYEFEFVATDKVSTITQTSIVSRGIPLIDIGKDDIVINGDITENGKINGVPIKKQKVLWDNYMYMNSSQKAYLSEKISEQTNGIVLVFCGYSNGKPQAWNTTCRFIPKEKARLFNGTGELITMGGLEGISGYKYLYIYDDRIEGNDKNQQSIASEITYNNSDYVLRYIIGV